MPTIRVIDGIQCVIYFNDHSPAHAHAIGPDWTVKLGLEPPDLEGASRAQTRAALKTVRTHQALLHAA